MEKSLKKEPPRNLYRYYANIDYAIQLISKGELFFSSPNRFNDPYDFFPSLNGIKEYSKILCEIRGTTKEDNKKIKKFSHRNKLILVEGLRRNFKVCSYTELPDSFKMWSYYANGFKGCCIGFDVKQMQQENNLNFTFQVRYTDIRPKFSDMKNKETLEQIAVLAAYKNKEYESEKEWRCIKFLNHENSNLNCPGNGLIKIDTGIIKEVILGNQITDIDEKRIAHACREMKLKMYKIQIPASAKKYKLEIKKFKS